MAVTLHVRAFYKKIPNGEGIETLKKMFINQTSNLVVTKFLYLILTPNNYIFNGIFRSRFVQWAQYVYWICQNFNGYIAKISYVCTLILEEFQLFTVNL